MSMGISSCEKIGSLFDVEFDTDLQGDLDVAVQEQVKKSVAAYGFEASATVDPLSDDDIKEYVDNIKSFDVNDVIVEVLSVNKDEVVFKSGTYFYVADGSSEVRWTLGNDWTVTEGTQITLEDAGDLYAAVAEMLDKKGAFTVGTAGECSDTDVFVTLRIGIDTHVTAKPL